MRSDDATLDEIYEADALPESEQRGAGSGPFWGGLAVGIGAGLAARALIRRRRWLDLTNKVCLVTGGSRGLGLEIARQLADAGAWVAICARDHDELLLAQSDLEHRTNMPILAVPCDLMDDAQIDHMVARVESHLGPIDVLVNNAGKISVGPLETMRAEDFQESMDLHFGAPLRATLAVLESMRPRRQGRIVNITSIGGKLPVPHLAPYAASKHALVGFSESLRTELVRYGIYVTTVVPGLMRTGSPFNARFRGQAEKEFAWFASSDVTPFASISAARAASKIIDALQNGDAELIMPFTAALAARIHGLMPGVSSEIAALIGQTLPEPYGNDTYEVSGYEADSERVSGYFRRRNLRAAEAQNE